VVHEKRITVNPKRPIALLHLQSVNQCRDLAPSWVPIWIQGSLVDDDIILPARAVLGEIWRTDLSNFCHVVVVKTNNSDIHTTPGLIAIWDKHSQYYLNRVGS
jgi:hypothetical protein